jgi:hypothetical protein
MLQHVMSFAHTHSSALMWVSCLSAVMFVGSLLLVPWLIGRAPVDFFTRPPVQRRGPLAILLKLLRNLVGWLLLVSGVAMLVLPGQGLLMVLLSLSLVDLPKKREIVRRIVQRPPVWKALSYFRERAHQQPFEMP